MVRATEKLVKKMAKGYERGCDSAARYIASSDIQCLLSEIVGEFKGICIGVQKDRGQGMFFSVLSAEAREAL